jgi:uncharacterized membrane protein
MRIKPVRERLWLYLSGGLLLLLGMALRTFNHSQATIASAIGLSLIVLGLGLYWKAMLEKEKDKDEV